MVSAPLICRYCLSDLVAVSNGMSKPIACLLRGTDFSLDRLVPRRPARSCCRRTRCSWLRWGVVADRREDIR